MKGKLRNKLLSIHCHFYQPPRENPWTDDVEDEESASPYRNWNERITRECYSQLIKCLSSLSHNWGPTLLKWIRCNEPGLYKEIVEIIRNKKAAIAQPYYHVILPLADRKDAKILIKWGIKSFARNFGYFPYGIWLPELAVDKKSLEISASCGVKFTILGSDQVKGGLPGFYKVSHDDFYLFVFDRRLSGTLAFSPDSFFERKQFIAFFKQYLVSASERHIIAALDGETFGHHKKGGDKALKALVNSLKNNMITLNEAFSIFSNLKFIREEEVKENTSWSCAHGIDRWKRDCGCSVNPNSGWNQSWREPLREAMDWLKRKVDEIFEKEAGVYFKDPWKALEDYIFVVEYRNMNVVNNFLRYHLKFFKGFNLSKALKIMEMKNAALAMFTSCGWFFDDISGLETQIILRYAKRAMDLAFEVSGSYLEAGFLNILSKARSNIDGIGTGKDVYLRFVIPLAKTKKEIISEALRKNYLFNKNSFRFLSLIICTNELRESSDDLLKLQTLSITCKDIFFWEKSKFNAVIVNWKKQRFVMVFEYLPEWDSLEEKLHFLFRENIVDFFFYIFNLIQR